MLQKNLFVSGAGGPLLLWGCRLRRVVTACGAYLCVQHPWGAFGQPRNLRDPQDLPEGVRSASSILGPWLLQVLRVTAHEWGHVPVGGVGLGGEERARGPRCRQPSRVSPCCDEFQVEETRHTLGPTIRKVVGSPPAKGSCASRQLVRPGWGSFQGRGPHQACGWGGEPPVSRLALLQVSAPFFPVNEGVQAHPTRQED